MQSPSLDIAPTDFGWTREETFSGRFTFVVTGDPAVTVPMWEGMSWIKKDIVPAKEQGVAQYDLHGETVTVPAITLPALMRDLGIQFFENIRISGRKAPEILAEWPGPITHHIKTGEMSHEITRHLMQWYSLSVTSLRHSPVFSEIRFSYDLKESK